MKDLGNDKFLFESSSREWGCSFGIIGIGGSESEYFEPMEGYDGAIRFQPVLTESERKELAEFMIERWKKFKGELPCDT